MDSKATAKATVSKLSKKHSNELEGTKEELECAVCLQPCVHPVKLPCLHIFCFLCVKGVANQSKRCAMCRQEIPSDFLDNPNLINKIEDKEREQDGYQWFYEGRNGWWQYDERTSVDLEAAYSTQRSCEILVAGFLYTVDFDKMVQQRRNDPSRRRRIKRDLSSIPKKGVAGLKISSDDTSTGTNNVDSGDETPTPPIVSIIDSVATSASTSSQAYEDSGRSSLPSTSQPSELDDVNLLHSNVYGDLCRPRRTFRLENRLLSHPNIPLLRNREIRSIDQETIRSRSSSTSLTNNINTQNSTNDTTLNSTNSDDSSILEVTNHLTELSVNSDQDINYSLETEEYRLPNDDEL